MNVSKKDLAILLNAVLKCAIFYEEAGMNAYNTCRFCSRGVFWDKPEESIEHANNCPVLIARKYIGK